MSCNTSFDAGTYNFLIRLLHNSIFLLFSYLISPLLDKMHRGMF